LRRALALAFTFVAISFASGCSRLGTAQGAGGRHAWTQPGVLRSFMYIIPNTLNPILSTSTGEVMIATQNIDDLPHSEALLRLVHAPQELLCIDCAVLPLPHWM